MASSQVWFSLGNLLGETYHVAAHSSGMTLADRLRRARVAAGMTQKEAALRLGIKPSSVAEWELGDTRPKISRLNDIAKCYNTTVEELVGPGRETRELVTRDETERLFIELLRAMSDDARRAGLSVMRTLANRSVG